MAITNLHCVLGAATAQMIAALRANGKYPFRKTTGGVAAAGPGQSDITVISDYAMVHPEDQEKAMKERQVMTLPGVPMVLILLVLIVLCGWWLLKSVQLFLNPLPPLVAGGLVAFCGMGFFICARKCRNAWHKPG
jgi:hypothetical protein